MGLDSPELNACVNKSIFVSQTMTMPVFGIFEKTIWQPQALHTDSILLLL